jgi:hypothetical protein
MFASRVFPGAALVRATFDRQSAFSSVDFPTFERPVIAICGSPSRGMPLALPPAAALVTKSADMTFKLDRGSRLARSRFEELHESLLNSRTREPRTAAF